jgi:hypothetical protein
MGFIIYNVKTSEYLAMNSENNSWITKNPEECKSFKRSKSAKNFLEHDTSHMFKGTHWTVESDKILKPKFQKKNFAQHDADKENEHKYLIETSKKVDVSLDDMEKLKHFKHYDANASQLASSFEVPNIDIVETIKQFCLFLRKMDEYAKVLPMQYTYIENCKLDYEHKIELDSDGLSYTKQAQLNGNYKSCLEERRRIKDSILILEKLLGSTVEELINGDVENFMASLEDRHYSPRVAPELFADLETVNVKPCFKYDTLKRDNTAEKMQQLQQSINLNSGNLLEIISGFSPIEDCGE